MATVSVSFDTVTKALSVTVDGKAIADVDSVNIYKRYSYDDEDDKGFMCSVETRSEDKGEGTMTFTRLCASESVEAKRLADLPVPSDIPGFVLTEAKGKAQSDIHEFFNRE